MGWASSQHSHLVAGRIECHCASWGGGHAEIQKKLKDKRGELMGKILKDKYLQLAKVKTMKGHDNSL